ncbi:MAG: DUF3025 domain-containing protein [Dokdonella sp.]
MADCAHPLLQAWSDHSDLIASANTSTAAMLEHERGRVEACDFFDRPAFVAQDLRLLADGLHYEERVFEHNVLATRECNPHDLFNALIWLRHPQLKRALNARQVADIRVVGPKQRTRGQCAMTHFDEAGVIVWLAAPDLLPVWDAHDWAGLFLHERAAWGHQIAVTVFGHALIEHAWTGNPLSTAKAVVVQVPASALAGRRESDSSVVRSWPEAEAVVAHAIESGRLLADPQESRPLPLAGIPGWHSDNAIAAFYHDAPCFRPLRAGRRYPPPLNL